eukprot:gene2494-5467_t
MADDDRPSGNSAGFGFVKFQEKNAAEKALLALNGNYHLGHELRVNWALPNSYNDYNMHQLFVGDLPADITDAQLYNAFCTSGQCSDVRIMWDHTTGRSKGYGFVSFHIKEDADNALVKMHVYGDIAEVKLHKKGGYGFVKFCAHESAVKAIVDLQGKDCQGRVLKCSWGKNISLLMPLKPHTALSHATTHHHPTTTIQAQPLTDTTILQVLKCSWGKNISLLMPVKPHAALSDANTLQLPVLGGLEWLSLSSHGRLSLNQGPLSPLSSITAMHPKLARDSSLAAVRPNLAWVSSMTAMHPKLARDSSLAAVRPNLARVSSMTAMHPKLARDSSMAAVRPNLARVNSMTAMHPNLARVSSMTAMHPNLARVSSMAAMRPNLARVSSMTAMHPNLARGVHGMSGLGSETTSPPARMMMQGMHGMSGLGSETSFLSPQRSLQGMTAICMQPYTPLALSEHTIFQGTHGMNGCARHELMGAGSARSSELGYPDSILSPAAPHAAQTGCLAQQLPTQPRLSPQLSSTQSRSSAQQLAMQPRLSPQHSSTQIHFSAQQLPMQQLLASMGDKGGLDLYMGGGGGLDLYMGGGGVLNPSLGETYPKAYHADLAQQMQALEGVHADGLGACGVYMDNRNSDNRMLPSHYR